MVEEPFSDQVVCKAVKNWLRGRNYEFGVEMIPLDRARGSGLIKTLRTRGLQSEGLHAIPLEEAMSDLERSEKREKAE